MLGQQQENEYITVSELEQDILAVTGDPVKARNQAHQIAIMYKGEIIDSLRFKRGQISKKDLELSRHIRWCQNSRHSHNLSENMLKANRGPRPNNTAAHHIVAWSSPKSAKARLRLAAFCIDIDHEANGVFLPIGSKYVPMFSMPEAMPHSKTHTIKYYLNVEYLLEQTIAENLGRTGIIETLEEIGESLEDGDFPIHELLSDKATK